ncbi:MAG: alpha/beta fold hydrolase [Xenococcus sp. (in: cyanobacteria)]
MREDITQKPPGELIDIGEAKLHLYRKGTGNFTVILDHSLGGIEGYFLIDALAEIAQVCIYDRAGYGWSDRSQKSRCSKNIVKELDLLLTKANIKPPYILIGDSFGSYNMRLYAHQFPKKVVGMILTDGLHEKAMLDLPPVIKAIKLFFLSGFIISIFGSVVGIIRLLGICRVFELIKPELNKFSTSIRQKVKRSFYRPQHWLTMAQEISNLENSAQQLIVDNHFNNLPIVSIKAQTFLKPSLFNFFFPFAQLAQVREQIHRELNLLSDDVTQLSANRSSHFVWLDEPEIIVEAVKIIKNKLD